MNPMEQQDTEMIVFLPRDDEELTGPPHPRSEQRTEELWRELETARHPDWVMCLTLAVATANGRAR